MWKFEKEWKKEVGQLREKMIKSVKEKKVWENGMKKWKKIEEHVRL